MSSPNRRNLSEDDNLDEEEEIEQNNQNEQELEEENNIIPSINLINRRNDRRNDRRNNGQNNSANNINYVRNNRENNRENNGGDILRELEEEDKEEDKEEIFIDNRVIFIPKRKIEEHEGIRLRNEQISKNCKSGFKTCGIYDECESYIILALRKDIKLPEGKISDSSNNRLIDDLLIFLDNNPDYIVGHLIATIFENHVEIYDICILETYKGQLYDYNLLTQTLRNTIKNKVWLGIKINDTEFNSKLELYVKTGFQQPQIVTQTPQGRNIGFPVLGLTYWKNEEIRRQLGSPIDNYKLAQQYLTYWKKNGCITQIQIVPDAFKKFNQFLSKNTDYTGHFNTVGFNGSIFYLNIDESSVRSGEFSLNNQNFNKDIITFHTHSNICKSNNKTTSQSQNSVCPLKWPSVDDLLFTYENYIDSTRNSRLFLHIVITSQGLYYIGLTPMTISIIDYIITTKQSAILDQISNLIINYFNDFSFFNSSNPNYSSNITRYIFESLSVISQFTIIQILRSLQQPKTSISTNNPPLKLLDQLIAPPHNLSTQQLNQSFFSIVFQPYTSISSPFSYLIHSTSSSSCPLLSPYTPVPVPSTSPNLPINSPNKSSIPISSITQSSIPEINNTLTLISNSTNQNYQNNPYNDTNNQDF